MQRTQPQLGAVGRSSTAAVRRLLVAFAHRCCREQREMALRKALRLRSAPPAGGLFAHSRRIGSDIAAGLR